MLVSYFCFGSLKIRKNIVVTIFTGAKSQCWGYLSSFHHWTFAGRVHASAFPQVFSLFYFSLNTQDPRLTKDRCHSNLKSVGVPLCFLWFPATCLLSHCLPFPPALSLIAINSRITLVQGTVSNPGQVVEQQHVHIVLTFTCLCKELPFKSWGLLRCLPPSDCAFEVPYSRAAEDSGAISCGQSQRQEATALVWCSWFCSSVGHLFVHVFPINILALNSCSIYSIVTYQFHFSHTKDEG